MASTFSKLCPAGVKAAARSLGFASVLDDPEGWAGFRLVITARLTERQRAGLAYAALTSLGPATLEAVVDQACCFIPNDESPLSSPQFRQVAAEYRSRNPGTRRAS